MNAIGIKVIRFKNEEVENNLGDVLTKITKELSLTKFPFSNIREGARG